MKFIQFIIISVLLSCGGETSDTYEGNKSDTIATLKTQKPIIDTVKPDLDTLFMDFRAGMAKSEYYKHLKELLRLKRLYGSTNEAVYKVETTNDYFLEDMVNKEKREKKEMQTGVLVPEFFNDSLVALKITFSNPTMKELYPFLLNLLNEKYYDSYDPKAFYETVKISKKHYFNVKWTLKNTIITLSEEPNSKSIPTVILKYECISCSQRKVIEKSQVKEKYENDLKSDL